MQLGADIGERAPRQSRLEESRDQNNARERIGKEGGIVSHKAAPVGGLTAALACFGIDDQLEDEAGCGEREHAAERKEHIAPAEQIAEHAAHRLPEKLSENIT